MTLLSIILGILLIIFSQVIDTISGMLHHPWYRFFDTLYMNEIDRFSMYIGTFLLAAGVIAFIVLSIMNGRYKIMQHTISVLTKENADIKNLIASYNYELSTNMDLVLYVSAHPESDALIKEKAARYNANEEKITDLTVQCYKANIIKWWLYFGGKHE